MPTYIFKPKSKGRMHYQFHDEAGRGWNTSLCGETLSPVRTINPPFALGRGVCKHCIAALNGTRKIHQPKTTT